METLTPPEASRENPLSRRQYAMWRKRRGLPGGSHVAVGNAVNSGRLRNSVDADGRIIDVALADAEWAANTDLSEAPGAVLAAAGLAASPLREVGPGSSAHEPRAPDSAADGAPPALGMTLPENNAVKAYWQARTAELEFKEAAGELVPAAGVRAELESVFRSCRTRLLGIPSRARQLLPGLSVADVGVIENLVREALEDLAKGETT